MKIFSFIGIPGRSDRPGRSAGSVTSKLRALSSAPRASHFTLVELLVAMVVLSILMLLLFRFFGAASDSWTRSAGNMRIYQNARAAMDLIEQDLRAAVLSDEDGASIEFHVTGTTGKEITFVTATGESDEYASELVEVTYQMDSGNAVLERAEIGDDAGVKWNFLNATGGWHSNGVAATDYQTVIGGVQDVKMIPYDSLGSAISTAGDYADVAFVTITLTLRDEKLTVEELAKKTERTFTKTVFLNQ